MNSLNLNKVLLDASTSNIAISDGTDTLSINGDGSLNATVTATDLDIRDLTHVSDSIKIGDGTDFLAVAADGSIAVTQAADSAFVVTKVSVDNTVGGTQLIASAQSGRRSMVIENLGNADIYIKDGTGATINDFCIPKDTSLTYSWGPSVDPYAITASGTSDIRVLESA